jgi:biopolymer transport protein ExbD
MRIPSSFRRGHETGNTMTSMIDVVFLLLIFFICTASFQVLESTLPTSLEAAGSTATEVPPDFEQPTERVIVKLSLDGGRVAWVVNDRPYDNFREVHAVLRQVASIDNGLPVIVDADGAIPLGDVIDIYDLCRLAGFIKIQFAAPV